MTTLWRKADQGANSNESDKCLYKLFVSFSPKLKALLDNGTLILQKKSKNTIPGY